MAKDEARAEVILESIARHLSLPIPRKRIYRLGFRHNGIDYVVEVGKPAPSYYGEGESPVEAILGESPYVICLENRGVRTGSPIYASNESVHLIEFFEFDARHLRGAV